jgi:hypothetical protein
MAVGVIGSLLYCASIGVDGESAPLAGETIET